MDHLKIVNVIEVPKSMLILTTIWPYETPSIPYRLQTYLAYILSLTLQGLMTVEVALSEDMVSLSDILLIYFQCFGYVIKLINFHWNKTKLFSLSRKLQDPMLSSYEECHRKYVKDAIWKINLIGRAIKYNCALCFTFYCLKPWIGSDVFPVAFPFFHEGLMWYIIYFVQLIALSSGCWNCVAIDILCVAYMSIAVAELDILKDKLKYFANTRTVGVDSESDIENYLRDCCEHHTKIIEFIENIEDVFTKGIFAQCLGSVVVICNCGFGILITPLFSAKFVLVVTFFVAMMIEQAMYCWFGNEIILKSLEIGDACYMSEWYKFGPRINKIIFIMMERAKTPLTISACKFANLSLTTYTTLIQWSYSYFTLLRGIYIEEPALTDGI